MRQGPPGGQTVPTWPIIQLAAGIVAMNGTSQSNSALRIVLSSEPVDVARTLPSRNGMNRLTTACLALCLVCSLTDPALAADVRIGDVSLRLPQFPGHCEMDPVAAADARLFASLHASLVKTGNRLLVLSADCSELRDWRTGKRLVLVHLAQYQTVIALQNGDLPDPPQVLVDRYCNSMLAATEQSMPGTGPRAEDRVEAASRIIRVNEMKYLGVAAAEPLVCYAATLHKFAVENAGEFTQVTLIATTVVKNKVVICYLFAPYAGRDTIAKLLASQRANVRQRQRANRG